MYECEYLRKNWDELDYFFILRLHIGSMYSSIVVVMAKGNFILLNFFQDPGSDFERVL